MSKLDKKDSKKLTEGLKASKEATKAGAKKQMKKAAEAVIMKIAGDMPNAGDGKAVVAITSTITKLKGERKIINLAIRGERAKLREMKVPLAPYDAAIKMMDMEPEDARSFKASQAIIEQTLGLDLSPDQKSILQGIETKREESRKALSEAHSGQTGKEIGTNGEEPPPAVGTSPVAPLPAIPAMNEALSVTNNSTH